MQADKLATEVTKESNDDLARSLAMDALKRISNIRSTEEQTEEKILAEARNERIFRSAYAKAFVAPMGAPITGTFETPYGTIPLKQDGAELTGTARIIEQIPQGDLRLSEALSGTANPAKTKVRTLKFSAILTGRSGRFTLEIEEKEEGTFFSFPKSSTLKGLLIAATDGQSLELLEEQEKGIKIYTVGRRRP